MKCQGHFDVRFAFETYRTGQWAFVEARLAGKAASTLISAGLLGLVLRLEPFLYSFYIGVAVSFLAAFDSAAVAARSTVPQRDAIGGPS